MREVYELDHPRINVYCVHAGWYLYFLEDVGEGGKKLLTIQSLGGGEDECGLLRLPC